MDQRKQFISAWLKDDWNLSELCEAFGISRPTGYKWIERFKLDGVAGLEDRSRAHLGHPQATGAEIEARIIELRERHPYWGPRKLKARLVRTDNRRWPCSSTIGEILRRRGLVVPRRRRTRTPLFTGALAEGLAPNDVWAADFKGWFKTRDGTRPHEAIGMKTPGDMYSPSTRAFPAKLPEIEYPEGALIRNVAANGTISFKDKMTYVSNALRFQRVRLEELEDGWYAWFGPIQLGKFDRTKESLVRVLKV